MTEPGAEYIKYRGQTKEQLVAALRDPVTKGHRGEIVFALLDHDCSDVLGVLVTCVIEGSFEEVNHAVHIMEATEADLSETFVKDTVARLTSARAATSPEDWRFEAIDICLDLFSSCIDERAG